MLAYRLMSKHKSLSESRSSFAGRMLAASCGIEEDAICRENFVSFLLKRKGEKRTNHLNSIKHGGEEVHVSQT